MGLFCGKRCHERKMARIQAKTDRVEIRANTRAVAYENGIDPRASMFSAFGSIAESVTGIWKPGTSLLGGSNAPVNVAGLQVQPNMLVLGGVAVLLFMFMKKK
jgi:hypothetical protein